MSVRPSLTTRRGVLTTRCRAPTSPTPRPWPRRRRSTGSPPAEAWSATARWPGPRGGTSGASAGRTMARPGGPPGAPGWGTNRAPARLSRTGRITVARTGVLIKMASHPARTCVLITCMSQARYGPRPRSDVIPWCRQNGRDDPSGTVGQPVTCHNPSDAAAECRRLDGEVPHPRVPAARNPRVGGLPLPRVRGVRRPPGGRVRSTARVGAAAADPRLPRSLLAPQSRQRAPADGSARPRLTNARAPC